MKNLQRTFQELLRYPSALVGLIMISSLLLLSVYAVIAIPYDEAVRLWRGGQEVWYKTPKNAPPAWTNYFRQDKLPDTLVLNSTDGTATKTVRDTSEGNEITLTYAFDYQYDDFPQELSLYFNSEYQEKQPHISAVWVKPDGAEIQISDFSITREQTFRISQDERLQRRLGDLDPQVGLFLDVNSVKEIPLKGQYQLRVTATGFEKNTDVDAELVMYGKVYGLAGTDYQRRDLMVALLWGTPVALSFGLLAALGTTLTTMVIAAIGAWFGGWLDELIQRITEVNLVLPFLPILIMIGTFYSRSIFVILGVTILLSIFGGTIKTYRAVFLQVKESSYIEAARAYGASNIRIVLLYLLPRIIPLLIPQLVILIPTYVFLEASLAVLGLGDPVLPSWGKIIDDAQTNGALYQGLYYWVLEPSVLLMFTGLSFAMLGFSLDRIFNPRLRGL
jgi:peptide/nickel transport system permease protein